MLFVKDTLSLYRVLGICLATCSLVTTLPANAALLKRAPEPAGRTEPAITCSGDKITFNARSIQLEQAVDRIARACDLRIYAVSTNRLNHLVSVDLNEQDLGKALSELFKGCSYLVVYNEAKDNTGLIAFSAIGQPQQTHPQARATGQRTAPTGGGVSHQLPAPPSHQQTSLSMKTSASPLAGSTGNTGASTRYPNHQSSDTTFPSGRRNQQANADLPGSGTAHTSTEAEAQPSAAEEAGASSPSNDTAEVAVNSETAYVEQSSPEQQQADYFRQQISMLTERIESGASDRAFESASNIKDAEFIQDDRKMLASYEERLMKLEQN